MRLLCYAWGLLLLAACNNYLGRFHHRAAHHVLLERLRLDPRDLHRVRAAGHQAPQGGFVRPAPNRHVVGHPFPCVRHAEGGGRGRGGGSGGRPAYSDARLVLVDPFGVELLSRGKENQTSWLSFSDPSMSSISIQRRTYLGRGFPRRHWGLLLGGAKEAGVGRLGQALVQEGRAHDTCPPLEATQAPRRQGRFGAHARLPGGPRHQGPGRERCL